MMIGSLSIYNFAILLLFLFVIIKDLSNGSSI